MDELRRTFASERVDAATITFFEAVPCGGESHQDLVAGAWDFARLDSLYSDYRAFLNRKTSALAGRSATPATRHAWLTREWRLWQAVARRDPFLPDALLPAGYLGKQAWSERRAILGALASDLAKSTR